MVKSDSLVPRRNLILIALMLTMMLAAMDSTIVSTAIPEIVSDLGGFKKISWVFSIYLLAQTVTIPIYGKLADIYGRKSVLVFGSILFLAGSAASAGAWNMLTLVLFRGIQGLGAGSIMATVNTLAGDLYDLQERAKVQGWLSSMWGLSAIIGPAAGGAFAEYASWRWIFLINIPIGILAITLIISFLHEEFEHRHPNIDFAGAGLLLVMVGLLIVGLMEGGQSWPWLSWPTLLILIAVLVLGWLTIKVERRAAEPIMPLWIWKERALAGANLSMIGMGVVMMGPDTYLPTFTQTALGLGAIAAGFILASESIGWPVASAMSGKLYLKIGFRNSGLIGAFLIILACGGFLLLSWPQSILLLILDQVLLGAGFGLLSTPMLVGVQSVVGWDKRGVVTGTNMFGRYLGQCLGSAVFGAIFNTYFLARMAEAPAELSGKGTNVLQMLHSPDLSESSKHFLEITINQSTRHIYIGLLLFAVLTFLAVWIAPRHFRKIS